MQLKDIHRLLVLNTDDAPADLQPGEVTDMLNMRSLSSSEQHGSGNAETLQGELGILINPDSLITYYGNAIGGQFVYSGYEECKIGNQVWMKKNWDAKYPGSKVYNDDENNRDVYGGLYTHGQILASDFCPDGWHVPTEAEVDILIAELLGAAVAGGKMKDIGWWDVPNTGADDSSGFKAMPGGGNGFDIIEQQQVITSFNDYFLPSKDELNAMYAELKVHGVGGFANSAYWSSSEASLIYADYQNISFGGQGTQLKNFNVFHTRACRAFTSSTNYNLRDIGPAGGLIFWKSGNDYLEAAPSDQSASQAWSNIVNVAIGTTGIAIGSGQANTTAIINQVGHTDSAAKLCDDLTINNTTYYGMAIGSDFVYDLLGSTGLLWLADEVSDILTYNDWLLPSKEELDLMYNELYLHGVGNFTNNSYWSSSEISSGDAWQQYFDDGTQSDDYKDGGYLVRACRSFIAEAGAYSLRDIGPAGGLIFVTHDLEDGTFYYWEAAPTDQSSGCVWSNIINIEIGVTAQGVTLGDGQNNTTAIINQIGHTDSAAKLCNDLVIVH